jgi:hypothetical protein
MPQRKTNRLPHKPLYQEGYWYFVTICVQDMECIFGDVGDNFNSPIEKSSVCEKSITKQGDLKKSPLRKDNRFF